MKVVKRILPLAIISSFLFLARTAVVGNSSSGRIPRPALPSNPWTTILSLNPTWDANGACEEPFSSGTGYRGIPQWVYYNIDLSSYANKAVKIRFYFDTNDSLYNKFEGWYLDNIRAGNFFDDVESGNIGWSIEGSHTTPSWQISNKRSEKTSSHSWLYQDELRGSFQAGTISDVCSDERNWGTLTSSIICLGSEPKLEFDTLWEIESVDPHAFDMMYVQIEEVGLGIAPNGLNVCELEKGDIVMINASGALYFAESKLYSGYWGHTGIFFGDNQIVESYPESFWPVDTPGVVKRPIDQSGFWQANDWVILRLKEQYNHYKGNHAAEYAKDKIGLRYNWDFRDKEQTDSFYCTQLVWRAYKNQTVDLDSDASAVGFLKPILKPMVTPDDIFYSTYVDAVASRKGKRAIFYLASPAHFYITNPEGQHVGINPKTGQVVNEIPDVFYSGPDTEPEFVGIPNMEGEWSIQVVGVESGSYTLLTEVVDLSKPEKPEKPTKPQKPFPL